MQKIKWDGKQKQVNYQLQILLSQMGFFTNLKTKKIKFNPKPNKEKKQKIESETPEFGPTGLLQPGGGGFGTDLQGGDHTDHRHRTRNLWRD